MLRHSLETLVTNPMEKRIHTIRRVITSERDSRTRRKGLPQFRVFAEASDGLCGEK